MELTIDQKLLLNICELLIHTHNLIFIGIAIGGGFYIGNKLCNLFGNKMNN